MTNRRVDCYNVEAPAGGCAAEADNPERFFIVGILSIPDAMMDRPVRVVEELPLSKDMQRLLHRRGRLGRALYCVEARTCDLECGGRIDTG